MSVSNIGATPSGILTFDASSYGVGTELALLVLETEEGRKQYEDQRVEAARADYAAALDEQVSQMHEEADHLAAGAWVRGLTTVASGAAGFVAAEACKTTDELTKSQVVYQGLGDLAEPLGTLVGSSPAATDRADATAASGEAEHAQWALSDAQEAIAEAEQNQDRALDWAASLVDKDAATRSAVLSNMA